MAAGGGKEEAVDDEDAERRQPAGTVGMEAGTSEPEAAGGGKEEAAGGGREEAARVREAGPFPIVLCRWSDGDWALVGFHQGLALILDGSWA